MPDATIEKILTDIQSLSPDRRAELIQMLNEQPAKQESFKLPITPRIVGTYTPKDRSQEWEWLAQHSDEYAGQWVALDGDHLLAHGPRFKEVREAVKNAGVPDALIVRAERSDAPPFVGI